MSVNGRPSKFEERFCEMLIEHQSKGFSFESFAATIGTHRDTLYEWAKVHPTFSDARKTAKDLSLLHWEKQGHDGLWGGKAFNPSVWIFSMKNRFPDQWRDKTETEITGTPIQIKISEDDNKL